MSFGPFTLAGHNTTGGEFQARVYWNHTHNYFSGLEKTMNPGAYYYGVGYAQKNFTVTHESELKIMNPLDAQDDLKAELSYLDSFTLKVLLNDTHGNQPVSDGSVTINWTSILNLNDISGGFYSRNLNTLDLGGPGIYYISINSSKVGYINATTLLTLNITAESILDALLSPAPAQLGSNFTMKVFYHIPGDTNYNYSNAVINLSTAPTSGYLTEGVDYVFTDFSDGTYNITLLTGLARTVNQTGEVKIYVHADKDNIAAATKEIPIYINKIQTNLDSNKTYFSANLNENVTLFINYTQDSDSSPILGANININGIGNLNYTINEEGAGLYSIEINSSSSSEIYDLSVSANKSGYEQKSLAFILSVNTLDGILQLVSGESTVNFRNNLTLLVLYSSPSDQNVNYTGATITVSSELDADYWTENTHFSVNDNLNGTYTVKIFTGETYKINESGQNLIHIHANKTNVQNATLGYTFYVNSIGTNLETNKSYFSMDFNENATFFVNYTSTVDSSPILNANISISGEEGLDYTITEEGLGLYSIEINSSSTGKAYNIIITASKTNYEQKSLAFILSVNTPDSSLQFVSGESNVNYRSNLTLLVLYSSPSDQNENYTGATISVSSELDTDYWIENTHFSVNDNLNGTYTVKIFTGETYKVNESGQNIIHIHANKTNVQNATLSYTFYVNSIGTNLETNKSYFSTDFNENATFFVNYTSTVDSSPILNANISISGEEGLDYTIIEEGLGLYSIEINSSSTEKAYDIIITANKTNYEQKSLAFILSVNTPYSSLQLVSGESNVNYRNNLTLLVLYSSPSDQNENYTGATISVSSELDADYWTENTHFSVNDNLNGTYTVKIFTGETYKVNESGQNLIHIHANRTDIHNATLSYTFYVNPIGTNLETNKSYFSTDFNENATFFVNYTSTVDSSPILNANISISGEESLDYTITEEGLGLYSIEINSSSTGKAYNIIITANKTNHEQKSLAFILSVNTPDSSLQFVSGESNVNYRSNLTLLVLYSSPTDPNENFTGATISVSSEFESDYWTENIHFSVNDNLNGTYTVKIFTGETYKINESGQNLIHIHANKTNVQNATLSYTFYVNQIEADLSTNKSSFSVEFFENITLFVNYTTTLDSIPILGSSVNISGHENLDFTIHEEGNGLYSIEINASSIGKVYNIIITLNKTNYEQKSIAFILLVNTPDSTLQYVSGESTVNFRDNLTLLLLYASPSDTNVNYTGATIQISSEVYADYWIVNLHYSYVDNLNGTYTLTIFTGETRKINSSGQNVFHVHANKTNVQNATLSYTFYVNPIAANLVTNQSFFSAKILENVTYYINYTASIDSAPLLNAEITISGQENLNYTIKEEGTGLYSIEFNASDTIKTYDIFISANLSGYELKTVAVILTVNPYDTMLQYVSGSSTINFRSNLTLLVLYSKLNDLNTNFSGATIRISSEISSDYWVLDGNFSVIDNLNGTYTLHIFTGEDQKINASGQNVIHIHANKTSIQDATLSYTFYVNPIDTELLINDTIFEIPKYETINFTIKYQTKVGSIPLDGAFLNVYGYSDYSVTSLSQGLYRVFLTGTNQTGSNSISLVINKTNYALATVDIVFIVRALDQYTDIQTNWSTSTITTGGSTQFRFSFYNEYLEEYFTGDNITVKYQWAYGSGNLTVVNNTDFILDISTTGIPIGQFEIKIFVYDNDNALIGQTSVYLTINNVPTPPWIYMLIGAGIIAVGGGVTATYYYKVRKPRKIYKNKVLMEKYYRYFDSHNVQRMLIIDKNSGLRIGAKNYGSETPIDEDLVSGFIQAISSFGQEISKLDTAVMENISYKGFKILLESGKYVDICLLLNEHESPYMRNKIRRAKEEFETEYEKDLKEFMGNIRVFDNIYPNFDDKMDIYLTQNFQINLKVSSKKARFLNKHQKALMRIIVPLSNKPFKIKQIMELAKKSKIKLQEPEIFAEIFDMIEKGIIILSP
ncbi:MAG: hypothetical protein ACTSVE_13810 [Candidatus Helarchaeota archaeon]